LHHKLNFPDGPHFSVYQICFINFYLHSIATFTVYAQILATNFPKSSSLWIITGQHILQGGPGCSVGIATDYGLDGPGSNPGGNETFRPPRPAMGPTQPPVKRVPSFSRGVKCGRGVLLTTHPLLVPRSWKRRAIPLPTLWATPGL